VAIRPPPLKAPPALVCDWLEMTVAASIREKYSLHRLKRIWDVNRETEDSDPEGLRARERDTDDDGVSGEDADAYLDSISDEIGERETALGNSYPFELDAGGNSIKLKNPPGAGGYVYLFCLFLSNSKQGDILDGTWTPQIDHVTRDLFQACSTLAAAGEITGSAISFGWPRPNNNPPFLIRLREVYEKFGEGTVRQQALPGASPSPKDEEIDVIAWRPTFDQAPGTEYMLGQVASGDNWEAKSVKGPPIESFHRNWFMPPPASPARPAIFIPHLITPNQTGSRRDVMDQHTATYGTVIDRLRLPRFADRGIELADLVDQPYFIERRQDVQRVVEWVKAQMITLRAMPQ
jgi:hypothetical protein